MNVLQVVQFFSREHGGSAVVPYELSKQLERRGHTVTLVTTDFRIDPSLTGSLTGVEVLPFRCLANVGGFLISPALKKYLRENTSKFDVVHLHNYRTYQNVVAHHYARKNNVPYVLQAHGSLPRIVEKQGAKKLYDYLWGNSLLKDVTKAIAVSDIEARQYAEMRVQKEKILTIPNALNVEEYTTLPQIGHFANKYRLHNKIIILFLGRLHVIKGIEFLLRSYALLSREIQNTVLVIAGPDGGYAKRAKELITALHLQDDVLLLPEYIDKDKLSAYRDATVLVYPSAYEIFGLVPFEAVLCGTPIIITDNCGCSEMVKEGGFGYVIQYGDTNGLKDAMAYAIENVDEAQASAKRGAQYVFSNLTWEKIAQRFEEAYETCISHIERNTQQ